MFVVALARLGTALHHDLTLAGFDEFALLFFLLWWIWLSYSYAADLFGADDTVPELTFLAAMVVVLLLLVPVGTVVPSVAIVPPSRSPFSV